MLPQEIETGTHIYADVMMIVPTVCIHILKYYHIDK